jgi:hypothetical protein
MDSFELTMALCVDWQGGGDQDHVCGPEQMVRVLDVEYTFHAF